jgi:putative molybdopterin biosynthesis protein
MDQPEILMPAEDKSGPAPPELLTTREVALLLRIKERKVYDLVAAGDIPHVRVTGKLLFPRALVDAWLVRHSEIHAEPQSLHERPNVVVGSHDPLLDWALRESRSGLATFFDGSLDGLERMARREAVAVGLHLLEPADNQNAWNLGHVERALQGQSVVLIEWAWREQGLIVPRGNPGCIRGPADLRGKRVIPRQREAGSFLLLQHLLATVGLSFETIDLLDPPARTETDVALAVADGKAEVGLGLAAVAWQLRLDFLPVMRERYDLALWRRAYFEPPLQRLAAFCRSERFVAHARELRGYDVAGFGTVHYNGH